MHFADKEARPTDYEDILYKVRPVLNSLVSKLQQVYIPGRRTSIDEDMTMLQCLLILDMYMPKKPDRYDIKVYVVSESKSCYVYNVELHTGK